MSDDFWLRWVAVGEMLALITAGVYWLLGMRRAGALQKPLFAIGMAYGSVIVAFALVVVLNMLVGAEVSPGLLGGVILIAPPVGFVLWVTAREIRATRR